MKKIFTLLFALGAITSVFAQYGPRDNGRGVILGPGPRIGTYDNGRNFSMRDRDERIRQINWRYDNRIAEVSQDRYLRHGERKRQIRMLEAQRRDEIRQVNLLYDRSRRDDRWNRRY